MKNIHDPRCLSYHDWQTEVKMQIDMIEKELKENEQNDYIQAFLDGKLSVYKSFLDKN
jgi:intein-encoded DNA endonuclease-like protein